MGPAGWIGIEPETQALLEVVLIHLRLLDEFLGNQGRDTDVRAVVMSPTTAECASVRISSTVTLGASSMHLKRHPSRADRISDSRNRTGPPLRPTTEPRKVSPLEPVEYGRGGEPEQHAELARRQQPLGHSVVTRVRSRLPAALRATLRDEGSAPCPRCIRRPSHPRPDVLELARLVDDQALAERLEIRLRERRPHPGP